MLASSGFRPAVASLVRAVSVTTAFVRPSRQLSTAAAAGLLTPALPAMDPPAFSLAGKLVLLTGGAQGLGLVMGQAIVASGADLALVDLNSELGFFSF